MGDVGEWTISMRARRFFSYFSRGVCWEDGGRQASFAPKKMVKNWIFESVGVVARGRSWGRRWRACSDV